MFWMEANQTSACMSWPKKKTFTKIFYKKQFTKKCDHERAEITFWFYQLRATGFLPPTLGIHLLLPRVCFQFSPPNNNPLTVRNISSIATYFLLPSESPRSMSFMLLSWLRSLSSGPRKRSRKESCLSVTGVPLRDAQFRSIKKNWETLEG